MRTACLFIRRFGLACELTEQPALGGNAATIALIHDRVVREASPAAQRYGVFPGQRMREAFAACPYLVTIEARPSYYERRFKSILDRLFDFSPDVEPGPTGIAYIDLTGLSRHHANPKQLTNRILSYVPAAMRPRIGIAPGKFPAFVIASHVKPMTYRELPESDVRQALAPVKVDVLPVDPGIVRRLHQLGLHTLGSLADLPRHAVAAQFGPEGSLAWDLASGIDDSPVRSIPPDARVETEQAFIDPILNRPLLCNAVDQILTRATSRLRTQHQAARTAQLWIELERSKSWEKQIVFTEPRFSRSAIWPALRPVIENADLPAPVMSIRLTLSELTSVIGWQAPLWNSERRQRRTQLEEALRQLKSRYGICPVGRIVEVEPWSRIPERRAAIIAFDP